MSEIAIRATALLKKFYGYSSFRPNQLEIIEHAMGGHDSVVLMPTGGGKSVCFQIPALLMEGRFVVVVSPLIALMKDQVAALTSIGIPAASINSLQSETENAEILSRLATGKIKLLYISPERLELEMPRWNRSLPIGLFAIDEAHCISQWGHDFRPSYCRLTCLKELFPHVPVMALTATADRITRDDIAVQLGLVTPRLFIGSFDRPNISLSVMVNPGTSQKINRICSIIDRHRTDSGIVYCLSRNGAEKMHKLLKERGYRSAVYHAGLTVTERNEAQERFINGELQVICATVAFGMGIDKSNIRWVVNNNLPGNIESYYQEIGRAGRDGAPAEALMFYSYADIAMLQNFVDESGRQGLNQEKLSRIKEYAESSLCRRRILLSYFSESMDHDCGNCDVCRNPPKRFDGTIIAQKALSAVVRVNGQAGIMMLIDILRGSSRQELIAKNFHTIKTYGAGRDLGFAEWNAYITQLIQLGMLDIAYNEGNHLKITPYGMTVLRERRRVTLATFVPVTSRRKGRKAEQEEAPALNPAEQLMEKLKEVRDKLARKEKMAPYLVFTDKALLEMVRTEPTDMEQFSRVEGVGERKTVKYWRPFVTAIRKFKKIDEPLPTGMSHKESLLLLQKGYGVESIAREKGIKASTVYGHFADMINRDEFADFDKIITREQYLRVMEVAKAHPTEVYERLKGEVRDGLIRVALAMSDYMLRHK